MEDWAIGWGVWDRETGVEYAFGKLEVELPFGRSSATTHSKTMRTVKSIGNSVQAVPLLEFVASHDHTFIFVVIAELAVRYHLIHDIGCDLPCDLIVVHDMHDV